MHFKIKPQEREKIEEKSWLHHTGCMDLAELKQIIARGEDGQHQFKEDVRNIDSLAAEIVAFSNSQGGRIFIGFPMKGN